MRLLAAPVTQHLIDPELCLRCGSCAETCTKGAIQTNALMYVVDSSKCDACLECVEQCPTAAVDHWVPVPIAHYYSLTEQYSWHTLPPPELREGVQAEVAHSVAPASASTPTLNLYHLGKPAIGEIIENRRLTSRNSETDIRHIVIAFENMPVLEGQSVGIIPPGTDDCGHPHLMRVYSAASARSGEKGVAGHIAFTVKRVTREDGSLGVCSNYLCDLEPGDAVRAVGPFGANFLLPESAEAKIIMVATGTGVAPMRGMLLHRYATGRGGAECNILFFGARTSEDAPYLNEVISSDYADVVQMAFSRKKNAPKQYVQDRMLQTADQWFDWLASEDGYLYICGLKGLEAGVLATLEKIAQAHGVDWPALHGRMKEERRLHIEVY